MIVTETNKTENLFSFPEAPILTERQIHILRRNLDDVALMVRDFGSDHMRKRR